MTEEVNNMITLSGTVARITYSNKETGFSVIQLKTDKELITAVGILPFIGTGENINVSGKYTVHPSFGRQFKVETYERILPSDAAAVLKYLSSGTVKGVGPATARGLVELFGNETLEIIENHPERLSSVKGVSRERAMSIHNEFVKQIGLRDVMIALARFKISPEEAMIIFKVLGNEATELIAENPYVLCSEDIGFSFDRVETIAEYYNVSPTDISRLEAGVEYVLRHNQISGGHTCLPEDKLLSVAVKLLACDNEEVRTAYENLCSCFKIKRAEVNGRMFAFIPEYYNAEKYIAARLVGMQENIKELAPVSDLEIDYAESVLHVRFEKLQREAVKRAVETGVLVLTGGPGTGKTTILNAVINILERRNMNIMLAAPTGRAAKRMAQVTGREAKTLHRLLETTWDANDKAVFQKNESDPIECDALIVDEMSMVDALLFESLLRAMRVSTRLILVGDSDQLPSIGAGNVLQDIIESDILPSVRLTRIFRQAKESKIVVNAHAVISGEKADFSVTDGSDCFFIKCNTPADVTENVADLIHTRLPKAYGFDSFSDIQVLCPSRKLEAGSINLNNILQRVLNPKSPETAELYSKGYYFHSGDKVMQIKNNYDITVKYDDGTTLDGVFNGDIGIIESINTEARTLKVRFENGVAEYSEETLSELELAFAVTVHKSQGSEFDCVVLPLIDTPSKLQYRNLLYTAITRAKKLLIIVGRPDIFMNMAENDRKTKRYTALKSFIEEALANYE